MINTLNNPFSNFFIFNSNPNKIGYVYILTPCYGGVSYVNYTECLISTIQLFKLYNININVVFCKGDSLVTRARNNLIAKAMNDPEMTHMLFIDNDITWEPFDILKLMSRTLGFYNHCLH